MGSCILDQKQKVQVQDAYADRFDGEHNLSQKELKRLIRAIKRDRPKAPTDWKKNRNSWLSNFDIDAELKVYAKHIDDLHFVNATPMDFAKKTKAGQCKVSELCNLCLASLVKSGKSRIAIVLNTDYSDGPGEHWVAVFCDLRPGMERIVYFDSYAQKPEPEVQQLMLRWSQQWKAISGHHLTAEYNSVRHQMKNSECGVYCLYFLHCCVFGIPMTSSVPDDVMTMVRSTLFKI